MDCIDMDVRVRVLHNSSTGSGIQSVRSRGILDQLQLRLPDGRQSRKRFHSGVFYSGVVRAVHHDVFLLREDIDRGVDDE